MKINYILLYPNTGHVSYSDLIFKLECSSWIFFQKVFIAKICMSIVSARAPKWIEKMFQTQLRTERGSILNRGVNACPRTKEVTHIFWHILTISQSRTPLSCLKLMSVFPNLLAACMMAALVEQKQPTTATSVRPRLPLFIACIIAPTQRHKCLRNISPYLATPFSTTPFHTLLY